MRAIGMGCRSCRRAACGSATAAGASSAISSSKSTRGGCAEGARMTWVRFDDQAIDHPKFLALSHGAFRLWFEGMSYCNRHLTDGLISHAALKGFRYLTKTRSESLQKHRLWEPNADGILVHDYLHWNDSRAIVLEGRKKAKLRRSASKSAKVSRDVRPNVADGRSPDAAADVRPNVRSGVVRTTPIVRTPPGLISKNHPDQGSARSHHPVFVGQKLKVFEWQLDDCRRLLGEFADGFDLHAWLYELDAEAVRAHLVLPLRDGGAWLQAQLFAEAQRRGLPLQLALTPQPSQQ